ncbi:MAG: hypothetical protein GWO20_10460 [Candidatus Korarchaeota archaeon]|nr:hypothetical protein [Candidatus Korarchaeota archaeon]NIU82168.1 hypothetical protein [Candidatus Thorarchaeota archaeon]NIW14050.1 hypothetical protein [Candidatus Thorarchaeota archaeon]NIW52153.1 hypothetical protein [Candidatus Korarchaeota archaeon]
MGKKEKKKFECKECDKTFKNKEELEKHMKKHHKKKK